MGTNLLSCIFKVLDKKEKCVEFFSSLVFKINQYPQSSFEFTFFVKTILCQPPWLQLLALNGFLDAILSEISKELATVLKSEQYLCKFISSDGVALEKLIEIFHLFWDDAQIRKHFKTKILHKLLETYLDLRKITFQRNLRIEHAEAKILKILEDLTSNKGNDGAPFINACMKILKHSSGDDQKTPLFIFEYLYSVIHPEENGIKDFFIVLEKDPQQEDFLQGRMLGNPYPSSDIGVTMKDIKNKICKECELLALLEDDNGMELLVCNKIINLNLPVKSVYKNIWAKDNGSKDAMKIVYRMRGLLGDATEEFVEKFDIDSSSDDSFEQIYYLANYVADDDGLNVILSYLRCSIDGKSNYALHSIILKLLLTCVKVKKCLNMLCLPSSGTKTFIVLLDKLKFFIEHSECEEFLPLLSDTLEILDSTLANAVLSLDIEDFQQLPGVSANSVENVRKLLDYAAVAPSKTKLLSNTKYFKCLARIIGGLTCSGNAGTMELIYTYFSDYLVFEQFDYTQKKVDENKLALFCEIMMNLPSNETGNLFRDYLYDLGLVERAITYLNDRVPFEEAESFALVPKASVDFLRKFALRPSGLKYLLKILTGLANNHDKTQLKIAKTIIPLLHTLEQVSTDENVGVLAENLLEILRLNATTASIVESTRNFTKAEKKRLAMATREKQLNLLGMKANEKGQVILSVNPIQEMEMLKEESGLFCFICREGYNCQPTKVLGIYTFSKRAVLEDFHPFYTAQPQQKVMGHTTVTVFNIIHYDCHTAAVKLATRGRDEWESASLQNTNTKCNGILPLW